jgi:hypothetical protein
MSQFVSYSIQYEKGYEPIIAMGDRSQVPAFIGLIYLKVGVRVLSERMSGIGTINEVLARNCSSVYL